MKLYSLVALAIETNAQYRVCQDKFGTCQAIIQTCKSDASMTKEACDALCSMCEKTCGICVPNYGPLSKAKPIAVLIKPEPTAAPTPQQTTRDAHGFTAEELQQIQRPNSHDSFPCEKDQLRYIQTGSGFNPMCDENGHYYPVQCEQKSYAASSQTYEECFCVDIWDGARTLGSNEIVFGSEEAKMKQKSNMDAKCAPPFGYLKEIENRKKTNEWNKNIESKSEDVVAPCTQKYDQIKASNSLVAEKNSVYTSYSKIEDLPECDGNGYFAELQCDDKSKYCWCSDRVGNEIKDTRKYIFSARSSKPQCTTVYNVKHQQAQLTEKIGPCTKQVSVPGRVKLKCDQDGNFEEVQQDSQGRRYCHDTFSGDRSVTHIVNFDTETLTFYCMVKPTTTVTTTTEDPMVAAARAKMLAEQQKQQMLLVQKQLQEKLLAKYSDKIESKVQSIQDPAKRELVSQFVGLSAPPMAPSGGTSLSSLMSGMSGKSFGTNGGLMANIGTVGTSYRPSSYFPSSASATATAGSGAYVPGNLNSYANAYADASATSGSNGNAWATASSSSYAAPFNQNNQQELLMKYFG